MATHHELLGWDEERFWNATLRKLLLVWDEYGRYLEAKHGSPDGEGKSGGKQKPTKSSIDDLGWL